MRRTHVMGAAVLAAIAAVAIAVAVGSGSSHREAPLSSLDPTGDDTDLYAFTAKDAPGSLTIVANWIPFEDPAGGPNFYRFDDRARYYINVDNTGDGAPTSATGSRSRRGRQPGHVPLRAARASRRSTTRSST